MFKTYDVTLGLNTCILFQETIDDYDQLPLKNHHISRLNRYNSPSDTFDEFIIFLEIPQYFLSVAITYIHFVSYLLGAIRFDSIVFRFFHASFTARATKTIMINWSIDISSWFNIKFNFIALNDCLMPSNVAHPTRYTDMNHLKSP